MAEPSPTPRCMADMFRLMPAGKPTPEHHGRQEPPWRAHAQGQYQQAGEIEQRRQRDGAACAESVRHPAADIAARNTGDAEGGEHCRQPLQRNVGDLVGIGGQVGEDREVPGNHQQRHALGCHQAAVAQMADIAAQGDAFAALQLRQPLPGHQQYRHCQHAQPGEDATPAQHVAQQHPSRHPQHQ
ncbi:hypothetical protein WR25_22362 [Diploscapter pachys]|uniref:Uncharacterized protein n=1 Tax=Diploscapter pachys TaxID=2018661 RepID=A0A2A2M2R4_9BILA|nr:hypothetical protein WR25_22362 [Diploscapter pachys]